MTEERRENVYPQAGCSQLIPNEALPQDSQMQPDGRNLTAQERGGAEDGGYG